MKTIEYKIGYTGRLTGDSPFTVAPSTEIVSVQARDLNSGFAKALKLAREPLGNGWRREIGSVEFSKVVSF